MGNTPTKQQSEQQEEVVSHLCKLSFLQKEKGSTLNKIANVFVLSRFKPNQSIIKQGEEAHCMYVVVKGKVLFTKVNKETGVNAVFTELGPGKTFGEFGLVYDVRRTAGAIAKGEVTCLRLDRESYERVKQTKYMSTITNRVQEVCSLMMKDGLKQLPFLADFDDAYLQEIGHLFEFERVPAGTTVCAEGEEAERFYIVFNGELVVTMEDGGFVQEITRLHKGSKFGDVALVSGNRRNATVTCMTDCQLFSLGRQEFLEFLSGIPNNARLKESLNKGKFSTILRDYVPVFHFLSAKNLSLVALVSNVKSYSQGTTLMQQGKESSGYIYILFSGTLDVIKDGRKIKTATFGYFGEASLFSRSPYSSTVVVSSPTAKCLLIPLPAFDLILKQEEIVYSEIAIKVMGVDVDLEKVLYHPKGRKSFFDHCKKEFADESIAFWAEVKIIEGFGEKNCSEEVLIAVGQTKEDFDARKNDLIKEACENVFKNFVRPGAEQEINISGQTRKAIMDKVDSGLYTADMYHQAKQEVIQMVEQDNFWRYKESEAFKVLLMEVGAYKN